MDTELDILNNLKRYYVDADNNKIHLDDIKKERIDITPEQKNSICLWNGEKAIIRIHNKCNHLLIYNCKNITIHTNNFISGITCIKSDNCNILFCDDMKTNIEMSQSFNINIRSNSLSSNLLYMGVDTKFIKSKNNINSDLIKINDGIIMSKWKVKNINI